MLKLTQELFGAEDPDIGRMGEDESMLEVLLDFVDLLHRAGRAIAARDPTADLASVIANAEIDGEPLADLDMLGHYVIIATAGHDTTSNAIGGGLLALHRAARPARAAAGATRADRRRRRRDHPLRLAGEALHAQLPGSRSRSAT